MNWKKWTEKQIRKYLCRELHREDILEELRFIDLDDAIYFATSSISHLPQRNPNYRTSIVERNAMDREKARSHFLSKLQKLEQDNEWFRMVFRQLDPNQQQIIHLSYCCMDFETDEEIADHLRITSSDLKFRKKLALRQLHQLLMKSEYERTLPAELNNQLFAPILVTHGIE